MSRGFWICAVATFVSWTFTAANFVLYFDGSGDGWNLLAGVWCAAFTTWSSWNTVRIGIMDREERGWDR